MQKLHDATLEVERLGELFLINKEQLVEADKQRQANREAITALRRQHQGRGASTSRSDSTGGASAESSSTSGGGGGGSSQAQRKVWLLPSAMPSSISLSGAFLKIPATDALARIEADQKKIEAHIEELRTQQKRLTAQLAEKGAGPEGAGEGLLRAMLELKDTHNRVGGSGSEG